MLLAHLKRILRMARLRLRGPCGARDEFPLAADEQTDGKTVLTMRQLHPSRERRKVVIGFGAVEYGPANAGRPRRMAGRLSPSPLGAARASWRWPRRDADRVALDRAGQSLTEQDGHTRCLLSGGRYLDLYDSIEGAKRKRTCVPRLCLPDRIISPLEPEQRMTEWQLRPTRLSFECL
jgi:hypothetical protein